MKCPKCHRILNDANIHLDTFEDCDKDVLQVLAMDSACGYVGYVMVTPRSFVEVPAAEFMPAVAAG
jgi:hypothetical protein